MTVPHIIKTTASILMGLHITLAAFLIFQIQPMIAKIILPWYGGTAAVWTVCMLFFQSFLLLGYFFAHVLASRNIRLQPLLFVLIILAAGITLNLYPSQDWKPTTSDNPTTSILLLLIVHVGLPYTVLAMTSPLFQSWYSKAFNSEMPYRLYSLSNIGSLGALLSYPFLFEPVFSRQQQTTLWGYAFWISVVTACVCAAYTYFHAEDQIDSSDPAKERTAAPNKSLQLLWLVLSALGSILLLAITNLICNDIASVPFLWVVPLSLYLLTFIICFGSEQAYWRRFYVTLFIISSAWIVIRSNMDVSLLLVEAIVIGFLSLFAGCMICHGELVARKPAAAHLTKFYLLMSLGGALGGLFVGMVAPLIFVYYFELQLCFLLIIFLAIIPVIIKQFRAKHVARASLATLLLAIYTQVLFVSVFDKLKRNLVIERNFFGPLSIQEIDVKNPLMHRHQQVHGNTIHGAQYQHPDKRMQLTSYYGPTSGLGIAMKYLRPENARIGIAGLGAGVMAAFGRAGDVVRFYEINPLVIKQALDDFSFLGGTPADYEIIEGDARLAMENEEPQAYDLLSLDAFSSDAIPVHLITREAFELYRTHVTAGGVIVFNISNRYLDLRPLLFHYAEESGLEALYLADKERENIQPGFSPSEYVLIAAPEVFQKLPQAVRERCIDSKAFRKRLAWSDEFSNLLSVLK